MLTTRTAQVVLAAGVVLAVAGVAAAQTQIGGFGIEGYGEAGARFFGERPSPSQDAKFEEYRDINQGLYLENLRLRFFTLDEKYSAEFGGRQWGLQDQEFRLGVERLGLWEAGFDWDQMRHIYSTNARTFLTETSPGVFILPRPRPPLSAYNSAPGVDEISVRWDTAHTFFKLMPTPEIDLTAEYTRTHKDGERPMGMAFGSPGSLFLETLQPINQTVHDFRLRGSWATPQWQLLLGYTLSVFVNDLPFMRSDNPCSGGPRPAGAPSLAPCSAGDQGGPQFGTMSLPPDNMAHTFSVSGGANLPLRTRINSNLTYSLRLQNEDFLPQTSTNSLPASVPSLALPEKSLNGNVQILLFNLNATSRPFPAPVTLSFKYRLFDQIDSSDRPVFENFLINDSNTPNNAPQRATRFDYQRQNAELDSRWQIVQPLALTVGTAWEHWNRSDNREVPVTDEFFGKAALDWTPNDWLMVRASYVPSYRRMDRYCTNCMFQVTEGADPGEPGQSYLLRKFDETDRNQHLATVMMQITPTDKLTFTPSGSYKYVDYSSSGLTHNSANRGPSEGHTMLGLQEVVGWSAGMDVNWVPLERVSLTAGYMHESNFQKMRSRNRVAGVDVPDLDWLSNITDTIDTYHASLTATLIPGKLDLKLSGSYAYALGTTDTRNPNATGSAVFNANPNARAFPFPAYEDSLLRLDGSLRYHFAKVWTASVYYAFEQFRKKNWQTDTLNPFQPGVSSIWLGNDLKNYDAQIVGFTVGYHFK